MSRIMSLLLLPLLIAIAGPVPAEAPRLVLFIVVDQLRGDMPTRFYDRFGEGGFRSLMDEGLHYRNAHYRHANTFTAVGHATLATGGNTPEHGIAGNEWYDRATGAEVYCVEDKSCTVPGAKGEAAAGRSPRNLTSSTFADELILASGGKSRAFGVSIKDRGATLLAGRHGKAFWYDPESGDFVTSTYYYPDTPEWLKQWNGAAPANAWVGESWELLHDASTYLYNAQDDRIGERPYKNMGATFPHPLPAEAGKDYYGGLRFTPMGDQLTLDLAQKLVEVEEIGQRDATDILTVSLSATDYIGHAFGPNSLEAEDNLLQLDKNLAAFLSWVDGKIGLDKTLIVLSSDHGMDDIPEFTAHLGCDAGRHVPENFLASANAALRERFQIDADLVVTFQNPSVYLDTAKLKELGLDQAVVERALAEALAALPGFDHAVTRTDILNGQLPDSPLMRRVARAFHPERSGDVLLIQSPSWYLYPEAEKFAAMHGSPHSYDTYVPILFVGPGIAHGIVHRPVGPEDIAATLAARLGINPPSGNTGAPLLEVLAAMP